MKNHSLTFVLFLLEPIWVLSFSRCCHRRTGTQLQMNDSVFSESADTVFSALSETANSDSLTINHVKQGWKELNDIIDDGDLEVQEFENLFLKISQGDGDIIDKHGFFRLYESIDDLFEEDEFFEDDDMVETTETEEKAEGKTVVKEALLKYLAEIHSLDDARLPCGFDCSDNERQIVQEMLTALESTENLVIQGNGKVDESKVMGEWNLLYTSSRTMTINKSLSGLGRSSSDMAKFESLRMRLAGTKYLGKAEYIETFGGEEASFDVVVTGEWMLEGRKNILTGMPSTSLRVDPLKLVYGPTTNNADEWASLGPIKLLDILYLDNNLMLLRGNSNIDSLFVYHRIDR